MDSSAPWTALRHGHRKSGGFSHAAVPWGKTITSRGPDPQTIDFPVAAHKTPGATLGGSSLGHKRRGGAQWPGRMGTRPAVASPHQPGPGITESAHESQSGSSTRPGLGLSWDFRLSILAKGDAPERPRAAAGPPAPPCLAMSDNCVPGNLLSDIVNETHSGSSAWSRMSPLRPVCCSGSVLAI